MSLEISLEMNRAAKKLLSGLAAAAVVCGFFWLCWPKSQPAPAPAAAEVSNAQALADSDAPGVWLALRLVPGPDGRFNHAELGWRIGAVGDTWCQERGITDQALKKAYLDELLHELGQIAFRVEAGQ